MRTAILFSTVYRKINQPEFHTVRWSDFEIIKGHEYGLYVSNGALANQLAGRAVCVKIESIALKDLTDDFIREDADCDRSTFMALMKKWYGLKPNWKGEDSRVLVIYLRKV